MQHIVILGTLDTKGHEHAFLAQQVRQLGLTPILVNVGTNQTSQVDCDYDLNAVLAAAGLPAEAVASLNKDRGAAIETMVRAVPALVTQLHQQGRLQGMLSLGGSGGTAIATAAMRALPLGIPKVMVSTMASGNVGPYLQVSDIVMMPSIVDVSGLNRVSRGVFTRAAAAVCSMVQANNRLATDSHTRPLVVASMFGNTTKCVEHARARLEKLGYEVLVFHATGSGGRTMESLIASGQVAGVLDITTTEWADELVGGVLAAGPDRLSAAATRSVPAVICPGCLDMVNFGAPETVPSKFAGRNFYQHNPQVTLMRTTPDECHQLGSVIASKINLSRGPVQVLYPRLAISVISAPGQPFHDPAADQALLNSLSSHLRADIPLEVLELDINDSRFAEACADRLVQLMSSPQSVTH